MKKLRLNFFLIALSSLLILTLFSCQKEEPMIIEESPTTISSAEETDELQARGRDCTVDYNDIDITINWAADCSTATIILALCCDCTLSGGSQTGCTLAPGVLEMQTEECPFDFYYYQQNIPWISIPSGTCYPLVFTIQNKGCDVAFISQLWFNGNNLNVNYNSSQAYCP